jgi:hypothetical protein
MAEQLDAACSALDKAGRAQRYSARAGATVGLGEFYFLGRERSRFCSLVEHESREGGVGARKLDSCPVPPRSRSSSRSARTPTRGSSTPLIRPRSSTRTTPARPVHVRGSRRAVGARPG